MIGGKPGAANKPTALGTQLNASVYGLTKPTVIGTTLATLLLIWAANLRQGHSSKKAKKKGVKTYVENINALICSNPAETPLQMWSNNTNRYTMDFRTYRAQPYTAGHPLSVPDADFYAVVGVTCEVQMTGSFNDYGNPNEDGIASANLPAIGSGYAVGDTFSVDGGETPAIGLVVQTFGSGVVNVWWQQAGSGYTVGTIYTTTTLTGGGSGATIRVLTNAKQSYANLNSQYPMWNLANPGPNLGDQGAARWWPYVYKWAPSDGNSIAFPQNFTADFAFGIPNGNGFVNVYYMALTAATEGLSPLAFNRFTFEPVLGDGTEYADAGLPADQDLHPSDCGVGSSNADLGAAGLFPDWRIEMKGSHCVHPHGDADVVDMILDAVMSGQIQVGSQLGLIQRGVNCNDLPALIQKAMFISLEPATASLTYFNPNSQGAILIAITKWRDTGGSNPTISDTAGDTWTSYTLLPWSGLWTAPSVGAAAGNVVSFGWNGGTFPYDQNAYIFETDPSTDTVEDSASTSGSSVGPTTLSLSVTTTGPALLFVYLDRGTGGNVATVPVVPHWNSALPYIPSKAQPIIMTRIVAAAGTYTFSYTVGTVDYNFVMLALSQSQPNKLPKALGNIIDMDTLELTRAQDRAYGLVGSVNMNSQRKCGDWLKEFMQCANAAPVWSGFKLKVIPKSEVSAAGNGMVYNSYYANGPIATITKDDLIGSPDKSPVTITRKAGVDANNIITIEHLNRGNDYRTSTASQPESGAINFLGPRKPPPITLHEIQDPAVARSILAVAVRNAANAEHMNTFKFTTTQKWCGLECRDLVKIPDPNDLLSYIDVIITSANENEDREIECEAEPFIYGLNAPNALAVTTITSNFPDSGETPASVNTPIIFEPPPPYYQEQNMRALAIVVSDPDPNYGGCLVYVSTDGVTYTELGYLVGSAVTGVLTADWPAHADPDTVNDLLLDLTESLGELQTFSVTQEDQLLFPFYVDQPGPASINTQSGASYTVVSGDNGKLLKLTNAGSVAVTLPAPGSLPSTFKLWVFYGTSPTAHGAGTVTITPTSGTINGGASTTLPVSGIYGTLITISGGNYVTSTDPLSVGAAIFGALVGNQSMVYELGAYAVATLTGPNQYTLSATSGNHLRRAVFGVPATGGIDHPTGSRFAFLNQIATIPAGSGKGAFISNGPGIGLYLVPQTFFSSTTTLHFKFPVVNQFGGGLQDLATCTDYLYTPGGIVRAVNPSGASPILVAVN